MSERHRHYWHHPHTIWSCGDDMPDHVMVARYCKCGAIQRAVTGTWKVARKGREPDLVKSCQAEIALIPIARPR